MAINLTEDINHSGGGKIVSVAQSAGSWQSLATKATFSNFTANTTTKQNLSNGQFFYVLDEGQLYRLTVAGVGPFATFTLNSASFGDIDTGSFVTNNQTSSMSVATASYVSPTFISASAAAAGFGSGGGTTTDISALNTFTSSAQTSLTALNSATSSYALKTDISGAFTSVSSSISTRLTSVEGGGVTAATESIVTSVVTNNGSSYYIIDDIEKPKLSFAPGLTYRFNLSGIVGSHPFKFSTSLNGPTQYTTGVTSGSGFIQIEVGYNTTTPLYYYCTNHNGMGNEINVLQIEKLITNSQTSSMSVLSSLTASFISDVF